MSIIAIIIGFTMPAMNTVLKGSQLTQAGQMINDQLNLARQIALTKNHSVEVRFYQFGDPQAPGEQTAVPASGRYRAIQAFEIQDSGSAVPLSKVQQVPPSIIIDSVGALSSIISPPGAYVAPLPVLTSYSAQTVPIARVGTNYNTVAFRFLPDGSVNLSKISSHGPMTPDCRPPYCPTTSCLSSTGSSMISSTATTPWRLCGSGLMRRGRAKRLTILWNAWIWRPLRRP